ncbi:hypothetical protein [Alistipes putredinis]|uniref:hypothetical protein n=1 Tax=Alistipes putredinis TaxID=28117 RepID=UPI003A8F063B
MQVEKVNLAADPGAEPHKSQERIIADIFAFIFEGATLAERATSTEGAPLAEGALLAEGAPLAEGATPTEGAPLAEIATLAERATPTEGAALAERATRAEGAPLAEYLYITVIPRGALFDSVDHLEGIEILLCVFFHFR